MDRTGLAARTGAGGQGTKRFVRPPALWTPPVGRRRSRPRLVPLLPEDKRKRRRTRFDAEFNEPGVLDDRYEDSTASVGTGRERGFSKGNRGPEIASALHRADRPPPPGGPALHAFGELSVFDGIGRPFLFGAIAAGFFCHVGRYVEGDRQEIDRRFVGSVCPFARLLQVGFQDLFFGIAGPHPHRDHIRRQRVGGHAGQPSGCRPRDDIGGIEQDGRVAAVPDDHPEDVVAVRAAFVGDRDGEAVGRAGKDVPALYPGGRRVRTGRIQPKDGRGVRAGE